VGIQIFADYCLNIWKKLSSRTLPENNNLFSGTLPENNTLFSGTKIS
jgi:hypothetical protein